MPNSCCKQTTSNFPVFRKFAARVYSPGMVLFDVKLDGRGIIVSLTLICHRHDDGIEIGSCAGDDLLQVSRKGGNSAAAWQGITDECQTAQ